MRRRHFSTRSNLPGILTLLFLSSLYFKLTSCAAAEIIYPRLSRPFSQAAATRGRSFQKRDLPHLSEEQHHRSRTAATAAKLLFQHEGSDIILDLEPNKRINLDTLKIQWFSKDPLPSDEETPNCFLVARTKVSLAALNTCEEGNIFGYIELNNTGFTLEPAAETDSNYNPGRVRPHLLKAIENRPLHLRHDAVGEERRAKRDLTGGVAWDDSGAGGYFIGDLLRDLDRKKKSRTTEEETSGKKSKRGEIVCNGPYCEYFR